MKHTDTTIPIITQKVSPLCFLLCYQAVAALMGSSRVESVDLDLEFHQDYYREARIVSPNEPISSSVTMAIGSPSIPLFMKSVGGCDDPDTVKVAVIDGGIDTSHPDFSFCNQGFCQGKRFSEPTTQDWGISRNNHGNHVTGVSSIVICIKADIPNRLSNESRVHVSSLRLLLPRHTMVGWRMVWSLMGKSVSVSFLE